MILIIICLCISIFFIREIYKSCKDEFINYDLKNEIQKL